MKRISMFIFLVAAMTVSHLFGGIKDKLGLGLNINAHKLYGDTRSGSLGLSGGNLLLRYRLKPALFLESELGFLRLSTQTNGTSLHTDMLNLGAKAGYTFLTSQIYQPYVYFGIGALNFGKFKYLFEVSPLASFSFWDGYVALGVGTEFFASDFLAVNVTADFRYTSGDGFDGGLEGARKDGYLNLGLGFIYHFDRHSNLGDPFIPEIFPESDPLYAEVAKTNGEEETEGIVESTDQELEDDILPEPDRTRETVVYTVQPNDSLYKIAAIFYGDPMAYSKIVEDNPLVIENPDHIEAGQKLLITIAKGMPVSYTVKEGESLSKISNRFYGDPMKFKDIFLANQDTIEDPDIIRPGQVLKIFLTEK